MPLSHIDRERRRKDAVAQVKQGRDVDDIARDFGMTKHWVYDCCRRANVTVMHRKDGKAGIPNRSFKILRRLLDGKPVGFITSKYKVTKQWVSQIRRAAIEAGFKELEA